MLCRRKVIKVSDQIARLPPQVQERLLRHQQLQQTLQSILGQKQQVEIQRTEIEETLSELEKMSDDNIIYKAIGSLLVRAEKGKVTVELNEHKELLTTRAAVLGKQEGRLRNQLKTLQAKLQGDLNPVAPS